MSTAFVILKPTRPHVITPIRIGYLNLLVAPGRLAVFAVRLDTFEAEKNQQVFYIGTNQPEVLTEIRRHILANFENLPVAGEYMHRDIYDIAEKYGKDTFLMIDKLGTDKMPFFFNLKGRTDRDAGETGNSSVRILLTVRCKNSVTCSQPFTAAHEKLAR